jgi:23S rRNA pseudouridine1911/1915/1917 synthase
VTATSFPATPGRLDAVMAERLGVPRAEVQRAIAEGRVRVDGRLRPKSFRLTGGERVDADLREPGELAAEPGPLDVRYEDEHLLVVSKPAAMVVHPTASGRTGTLVNRLLALGVPLSTVGGPDRPGIVHRLDAGTSGVMLVAKDDRAHEVLAGMFRRHAVDRRYLALVRGRVEHDRFVIDAPLGRRAARIEVRAITGKEAATDVEVRERLPRATLVEARPRTGRTHQIRVHLAWIEHPVVGDPAYGGRRKRLSAPEAQRNLAGELLGCLGRQALHAAELRFAHPITGVEIDLRSPLPGDMQGALAMLRRRGPGSPH